MVYTVGASASRSAGGARGRVSVWRPARGGGDGQPERHEPAVQPAVGADLQLRARPADVRHHDLAGRQRALRRFRQCVLFFVYLDFHY